MSRERDESNRHYLPLDVAAILRRSRLEFGWSLRRAEREAGVSNGHVSMLERGQRAPSVVVAEALIVAYRLGAEDASVLRAHARHAGRGSPWREPSWAPSSVIRRAHCADL